MDTLDDLRRHLQWAIELEHSTIPPYLCALYSLDPARNPEAAQVVGTVLAEEMIHLALASKGIHAEVFPCDIIGPLFYEDDLLVEPLRIESPFAFAPDKPGLGVELNEAKVEKYRVE